MSLAKHHKLIPAKLTAKRSTHRRPRRAVTRSGEAPMIILEETGDPGRASKSNRKRSDDPDKARPAEVELGLGLHSHSVEVTLASPRQEPADFQRRLEALIEICQPDNAVEMELVLRLTQQITDLLTSIKQAART